MERLASTTFFAGGVERSHNHKQGVKPNWMQEMEKGRGPRKTQTSIIFRSPLKKSQEALSYSTPGSGYPAGAKVYLVVMFGKIATTSLIKSSYHSWHVYTDRTCGHQCNPEHKVKF